MGLWQLAVGGGGRLAGQLPRPPGPFSVHSPGFRPRLHGLYQDHPEDFHLWRWLDTFHGKRPAVVSPNCDHRPGRRQLRFEAASNRIG